MNIVNEKIFTSMSTFPCIQITGLIIDLPGSFGFAIKSRKSRLENNLLSIYVHFFDSYLLLFNVRA